MGFCASPNRSDVKMAMRFSIVLSFVKYSAWISSGEMEADIGNAESSCFLGV